MNLLGTVILCASLLAGCGAQQAAVSPVPKAADARSAVAHFEPVIAVSPPDANGIFHFSLCGPELTADPRVHRVFVSRAGLLVGDPIDAASLACIAKSPDGTPFGGAWQYGFHAHGFEKDGLCPPLRAGTRYEITVSGIGNGSLGFTVDANGVGKALSERNNCGDSR